MLNGAIGDMTDPKRCPECGAELSEQAASGLCPKCLLAAGLETPSIDPVRNAADESRDSGDQSGAAKSGVFPQPTVRYFGDYELIREIARGGMGVVYEARQVNLNRVVALKMILAGRLASESDVRRFYAEAESAASLEHPGIVSIFEIGEHEGQHYFSMAYVEGQSLADRLREGPLATEPAARLAKQIGDAVASAHRQGVIHRDIKPANVLIDREGNAKISDFGLAKRTVDPTGGLTATGQILGTPGYMAPEQASGRPKLAGELADIYSLGATLYAMLTGRPPFLADNPLDTLRLARHGHLVKPRILNPKVSRDLEAIVLKALARHPQDRFQSVEEMIDELDRYLAGRPVSARPLSVWKRAARANLLDSVPVPQTASIAGASLLTFGVFLPVMSLPIGRDRSVFECAPEYVAVLLFAAAAAFFLAGARQYPGLLAVCVISGVASGLAFFNVADLIRELTAQYDARAASWPGSFTNQVSRLSSGWWALGIGVCLLFLGAAGGLVRQADCFEAPRRIAFCQLAAALFVVLIGIGAFSPLTYEGTPESSKSLMDMSPGAARLMIVVCAASLVLIGSRRLSYLPLSALIAGSLTAFPVWKTVTEVNHFVHWTGGSCLFGGCAGLLAIFAAQRGAQDIESQSDGTATEPSCGLRIIASAYLLFAAVTWCGLFVVSISARTDFFSGVLPLSLVGVGIAMSVGVFLLYSHTKRLLEHERVTATEDKDHPAVETASTDGAGRRDAELTLPMMGRLLRAHGLSMLAILAGIASITPSAFMGVHGMAVWLMGGLLSILGFALFFSGPTARSLAWGLICTTAIYALAMLNYRERLFWDSETMSRSAGLLPAALWVVLIWLALTSIVLFRGQRDGALPFPKDCGNKRPQGSTEVV